MSNAQKLMLKMAAVGTTIAASSTAFAADYTAAVGSAVTEASGNQTAVILGVVTLAAIGFGVGRLLGWFK
ncbi:hypothetical protein ACRWQL_01120 [Shewanella sp. HL-SH4]|uniref:hypothetical protein n=1 Tax=Shewanella sp. HL-SH4 TaxID=3436240 RepID=UPI003EB7A74F